MAKQLNISLNIQANTEQAKREMAILQKQLEKLTTSQFGTGFGSDFTKNITKAKGEVADLQAKLQAAFNVNTGKLDFTKFNASITASGKSLSNYAATLTSLGPEGEKAFMQLTRAVAQSEIPVVRVNKLFKELGTTLMNTARWQISSSILHGFMGALQTAYGYAQDLNRSLNDIRIVTGYSANAMADFAERANKAAQALSTSTTAYTDAALIFYQQGLSDEQVEARTNATIKMANVTGENAEHVSSYMTAIWNNFDDGSKSLEYYADVMTELGARTAASSEEIAEGMEKFAAVGNTVGLSYEYAAAAVTTVVDKTRQSADIVGTSFKTLFARLEGLKLGETLDDGTTLNKYSQALAAVGVNIKDQNGELKAMDQILDEMGAKWNTLSNEQQVALAQTVGGVRQYTQLIALMEHYDAFQQNVQYARESEGTLQQQQNIYAQSWEASTDRVRAAWEALYQDIIKDNFFIELNNGLADFLGGIDKLVDSLGGVKGVLTVLAPVFWKMFGDTAIRSVKDLAYSVRMMFPRQREKAEKERTKFLAGAQEEVAARYRSRGDETGAVAFETQQKNTELLARMKGKVNEADYRSLEIQNEQNEALTQSIRKREEELALAEKKEEAAKKELNLAATTQVKNLVGSGVLNKLTGQDVNQLKSVKQVYTFSQGADAFGEVTGDATS